MITEGKNWPSIAHRRVVQRRMESDDRSWTRSIYLPNEGYRCGAQCDPCRLRNPAPLWLEIALGFTFETREFRGSYE
jgi:hypothetical protein